MPVTASLSPAALTAQPGSSVSFSLEVTNAGAGPETVGIELGGEAAGWAVAVPPRLTVPAGATARARVMVAVPRSPHCPPGPTPVVARVAGTEARAELTVAPFTELRASLSPRTTRARRASVHTLLVENLGNEVVVATVEPGPADGALTVAVERLEVTVGAGELAEIPVRLRARRRRVLGRPRARPFRLAIRAGSQDVTAEGLLVQERTRWPLPVAVAGAVVALAAVAAAGGGPEERPRPLAGPAVVTTPPPGGHVRARRPAGRPW